MKNELTTFKIWWALMLTVFVVGLLWYIHDLISALIVGGLLAYVLNPAADFLSNRTRLPHSASSTIVFITGLAIIIGVPAGVLPNLLVDFETLSNEFQNIISQISTLVSQPITFLEWKINLARLLPNLTELSSQILTGIPENAFSILEATSRNLVWLLVVLASTYYLLRDWVHLRDWLLSLPPESYQPDIRRIYSEIKQVWRGYLRGNLILMAIVGVTFSLAWIAIGIPGGLILGIIAGLFTIVPDIGPAIAAGLAVLVALFEGSLFLNISNFWFAVLTTGIYFGLINIKSIWIRPHVFGRSVHMHDGIVFILIMAAVILQGILGALIVVPVVASASVIAGYLYRKWIGRPLWTENNPDKNEKTPE